jgi:hypothetical protein
MVELDAPDAVNLDTFDTVSTTEKRPLARMRFE